MHLKPKDHLVVVGQVGCGKTTLLNGIMEEAKIRGELFNVKGSIAYVE